MAALSKEKVNLIAAATLFVASATVCGVLAWRHVTAPQSSVTVVDLPTTPYAATVTEAEVIKTDVWNPPVAQSRGRDWIYDTFSPPEILYNSRTKHFTVKPPAALSDDGAVEEAFGLELASVRPEPFRLQLIGYVGTEGNERGTFENIVNGEVFLGGAGRRVPKLGLTIKSLTVRSVEVKIPGSMSTRQRVASAVVVDDKTGKEVTITHRERHFTGELSAFVAQTGEAATREVRAGESFTIGDVTYRINSIKLSPPSIEVTRESPALAQPDRRTLTPRESDDTPAAPDGPPPVTQ
ncbi:MAG: hypothetical protein NTV51_02535 [Verrucomicrobia bacterium]|nr:hypothetical protein [Verrucomicrobiota bacterium]